MNLVKQKGFTLIELIVVMGIFIILLTSVIVNFHLFQTESDLSNSTEEIINSLRVAQNKTLASEGASQWGVYFDAVASPNKYILFKGSSYASRYPASDEIHELPNFIEIFSINLGGSNEVVFDRIVGTTNIFGDISLRLKNDLTKTKIIYVENSGKVSQSQPAMPSDSNRIKDSRHVHFEYSWPIVTDSENLVLSFDGGVQKVISISDNMQGGQIYWEGTVDVGGQIQRLKVHTHVLNNPDTEFCVHRDIRYNNKGLTITISGDATGYLIEYTSAGDVINGSSINVSGTSLQ